MRHLSAGSPIANAPFAPPPEPLDALEPPRVERGETYLRLASRRFLSGLPYRSPADAVEAGAKTVEEWCDCLAQARLERAVPNEA